MTDMNKPMNSVQVHIDDRVRLLGALLAATSWPDDEQARKPHGTHAHARGTRRLVSAYDKHPAVLILQALLDRGLPLAAILGYMLGLRWPDLVAERTPSWVPPTWGRHLKDFLNRTHLEEWWAEEDDDWQRAATEVQSVIGDTDLRSFLAQFVGDFSEQMVFTPNICYPTDTELGVFVDGTLHCVAPPRLAWGDNPPWPFDEDATHVYRSILGQFGHLLMARYLQAHRPALMEASSQKLPVSTEFAARYPSWEARFLALFELGLIVIFLEDAVSPDEARAFVLMEKKMHGLDELPGVVSVLRRYLTGREEGKYAEFADYLPYFARHLRVARTITSL
ncbi:MAG: hypothetical protein Kow0077_08670 [Anaerolineae bacterium]